MWLACPPSYPREAAKTQTPLSKPGFQVEELKFVPVRTWQEFLKIIPNKWLTKMLLVAHWKRKKVQICLVGCAGW